MEIKREKIKKKLLELSRYSFPVETRVGFFRVICSKRSFAIQDLRGGEWYRFKSVDDAVSKLIELHKRGKKISKRIAEEAKSLADQEKWEKRRTG